jgi:hypothetical protein
MLHKYQKLIYYRLEYVQIKPNFYKIKRSVRKINSILILTWLTHVNLLIFIKVICLDKINRTKQK